MMLNRLKNNSGLSVVELILGGTVFSVISLALTASLVSSQQMNERLTSRAEAKIFTVQTLMQIANFGRFADDCAYENSELTCQVVIDETQAAETIQFRFVSGTLTHIRNGEVRWSIAAKDFSIDSEVELSNGTKVPAYFGLSLTTVLPGGDEFSIRSGFHMRNRKATPQKRYAWSPMGGSR